MALSEKKRKCLEAHPELGRHQSMKRRHDTHDYQSPCIYMVTLVVAERRALLGTLCPPDRDHAMPWVRHSDLGKRVIQCWQDIPEHHPQVKLIRLQLMPDHLHGILYVSERLPRHLGHVINGFKIGCNKAARELSLGPLWEEGYNDRIMRNKEMLKRVIEYLVDNPRRLWVKRNEPEMFRVQQDVTIDGQTVSIMGNRFLLDNPYKVAVKCSRSLSESELETTVKRYLMMAQRGAVLVSPRISPGEKEVMDMAQEAGYPVIRLLENGFSPLWKPGGEMFDACACGQVLLVAPWPYHSERRTITREQCNQLNDLAAAIAGR